MTLATATATPGFWDWSVDPPLVLTVDLAILYWIGARRTVTPARKRVEQHWRSACFYAGLAVLVIALASPIEPLSEQLFWVHMIQHVLLLARRGPADRARAAVDPPVALPAARCPPATRARSQPWPADGSAAGGEPNARLTGAQLPRVLGRAARRGTYPRCSTRRCAPVDCTRWSTPCSSPRRSCSGSR